MAVSAEVPPGRGGEEIPVVVIVKSYTAHTRVDSETGCYNYSGAQDVPESSRASENQNNKMSWKISCAPNPVFVPESCHMGKINYNTKISQFQEGGTRFFHCVG